MSEELKIVISNIEVPFDDLGMQHTPRNTVRYVHKKTGEVKLPEPGIWKDKDYEQEIVNPQMEQNFAFEDSLIFEEFHVGNKCAHVTLTSANTGMRFYMSANEFEKALPEMIRGVLYGVFSFKKKGQYYSIYKLEI